MPLGADLSVHLDIGGPVGALLGVLDAAGGDLGVIVPPLDPASRDGAAGAVSGISLDAIGAALVRVSGAVTPLLDRIPGVENALPEIETALALLEQTATPDLTQRITDLLGRLDATLEAERGGTLGQVLRVLEIVKSAPEAGLLRDLASRIEKLLGGQPLSDTAFAGIAEILPALAGAAAALGGMARLDTVLEEAQRLSELAAAQLDRDVLTGIEAEMAARLGEPPGSLAGFIASLDLGDAAAVASAARELETISGRLGVLASTFRDGMAFGEATLVHLDLTGIRQAIEAIRGEIRGADLAPLERTLAALAGRLSGVVSLDLGGAPIRGLEQLLTEIEAQVETFAAGVTTIDIAALLGPLGEGLAQVTSLPGQLAGTLQQAADAVGDALDAVRAGVRALPLDDVAGQLRRLAGAVGDAIEVLVGIIGGVEDAIRIAADAAQGVLDGAEDGLDAFKNAVDSAFGAARQVIESADIDGVASEIEENIRGFLDIIAKADMAPFFAAASGGIGSAASVVEKVPFDLLPDSMEQDVVDAIRPIKQVDADATRVQIEITLEIQDGKFDLRPTVEAAIADLKAQLATLLNQIRALDPEELARPLQQPIDDFKTRVQGLSLDIELAPLREALDTAKAAVAQLDAGALLDPIEHVFDELIAGIDRFSPAQLIAPLDERLDRAREQLIGLVGLRTWRDRLDEVAAQANEIIGLLDVTGLERDLTVALRDFHAQLADEPRLGFLDALLAALAPILGGVGSADAFSRVAGWIEAAGAAAAPLEERARAIRAAVAANAASVAASDPAALADRMRTRFASLTSAIAALPAGPARLQFEASLTVDGPLSALAAMRTPWRGYQQLLMEADQTTRDLGAEGFAEVNAVAQRVAAAAAPFAPLGSLARNILGPIGLGSLDRGLAGLVADLLEIAPPRRLAQIVTPLLDALRGRLQAVVDAIIGPVRGAIDDLIAAIDVFDLSPVRDRLQAITDAVKSEITAFRPSVLLAAPLSAFADAKQAFAAFDPLGEISDALDALRARVVSILGKLDLGKLLEQPIAIFTDILAALMALDLDRLLGPILDRLDVIAGQIEGGLDDTFDAFKQLQRALPDRVGSTTVSASVSVSVG